VARTDPAVNVVASTPQPLRVVCRPDHPFAARSSVHPSELRDQPLALLPPQFGLRSLHDQLVRTHGLVLRHRLVTESQAGVAEALLTGHAVAVLPPVTVARHLESGQLVAVALEDPQVSAVQARLMVRLGRRLTTAARAMVAACQEGLFLPT
jgi:DNA-binding transcriptional LysR family regulator